MHEVAGIFCLIHIAVFLKKSDLLLKTYLIFYYYNVFTLIGMDSTKTYSLD